MGKFEAKKKYDEERQVRGNISLSSSLSSSSSGILCDQCSVLVARLSKDLSFKCVLVLVLSLSLLLFGIFSIVPFRSKKYGFEAQQEIKLSASAKVFFSLEKPVSELVPHIRRLEYDINEEIGVPYFKVVVLSMRRSNNAPNRTDVVFGALPDPISSPISPVSLSVMKSSLVEVFMKQINLTLTTEIFGSPLGFEILKFRGGITVMPENTPIGLMPQILFNFTLHNSISETLENIVELKDQLKSGLRLKQFENVFVQITSVVGSTVSSPAIIQASVTSVRGKLSPERLRQLAKEVTNSSPQNLGLDNNRFGKVKSITLSSYLRGTISSPSPSPSPGPASEPSPGSGLSISLISPSPSSELLGSPPPQPCPYHDTSPSPLSDPIAVPAFAPTASSPRLGTAARGLSPSKSKGRPQGLASSSFSPAPSPSAAGSLYKTVWPLGLPAVLMIFHLICMSN